MKRNLIWIAMALSAWTAMAEASSAVAPQPPCRRIVSLYPAYTEVLFALGLDAEIVGVARSETHPPQALERPTVDPRGGIEPFLALQPDLVLTRPMIAQGYPGLMEHLARRGVPVVDLQARSIDEMFGVWRELGRLTGRNDQADTLVRQFETDLAAIRARVATLPAEQRQGVYFESVQRTWKTIAPDSIAAFVLREAGALNAADDAEAVAESNIAGYSRERLLARADRVQAYIAQRGAMNRPSVERILAESGFSVLPAVREKRILIVDEDVVSRPGPRLLDGIRTISSFLYPELWKNAMTEAPTAGNEDHGPQQPAADVPASTADEQPVLVLAAFGTSVPEAQAALEKIDTAAREAFPGHTIRWAFTSDFIVKKLRKNGQTTLFARAEPLHTPAELFAELRKRGVTRAVVQSLHVSPGTEYDELCKTPTDGLQVVYGQPLLPDEAGVARLLKALAPRFDRADTAIVLCGHGNDKEPAANRMLVELDRQARERYKHVFVATVEGQPGTEKAFADVAAGGFKQVHFVPVMITAGDHIMNDVMGDEDESWKMLLKLPATCDSGLGEDPAIVQVFVEHLKAALGE